MITWSTFLMYKNVSVNINTVNICTNWITLSKQNNILNPIHSLLPLKNEIVFHFFSEFYFYFRYFKKCSEFDVCAKRSSFITFRFIFLHRQLCLYVYSPPMLFIITSGKVILLLNHLICRWWFLHNYECIWAGSFKI